MHCWVNPTITHISEKYRCTTIRKIAFVGDIHLVIQDIIVSCADIYLVRNFVSAKNSITKSTLTI